MNGMRQGLPVVRLKAGEMHCSGQPTLVTTVLGSCLSITFYSRRLGIGGICHGMLPTCGNKEECRGDCPDKFTYVDCSIRQMARIFGRFGARRDEIEVKCFGGADMFSRPIETARTVSIGRQNSLIADALIKNEGLTLNTRDVGGFQGRKLLFYTHTGEVLLKRLENTGRAAHPVRELVTCYGCE
jgi:chemotaxis protein CheD